MGDAQARCRGAGERVRVIAVTGTAGKTTTVWLAASVLAEAGLRVGVASDLGCVDADGTLSPPLDHGRPGALGAWIARLGTAGCTHAVVEVPRDVLAAGMLGRGTCATVVVGGAAGRRAATVRGPGRLARRAVAALAPGGCLIASHTPGRAGLFTAAAAREGISALSVGLDGGCDVGARPVERGLHGQTFLATAARQTMPVAVDVPVVSFVRNSLAAIAVGLAHGVPLEVAARGVEACGSVAGRVERLDRGQEFAAFLDAPRSRVGLGSTLASLRRLTTGRLAVVAEQRLADDLGADGFARPVRRHCDDAVVVPATVLDDAADEPALAAYARIDRVLSRLGAGDCLLVLGGTASRARGGDGAARVPLATLVDGWLRLAHPPRRVAA